MDSDAQRKASLALGVVRCLKIQPPDILLSGIPGSSEASLE